MSNDLNITRPTSRVIRAPGGSSAGMGGVLGSHNAAPAKALAVVTDDSPVVAEVSPADVEIVFQDLGKVGVIIAGDVAKEEITESLVKALVLEGVSASSISLSYVPDTGVLPYAALSLAKTVKLVVAASAVIHDPKGVDTQALTTALLNIGIQGTVPIVPALVNLDSLLEVKAVLPTLAAKWAKIVRGSLVVNSSETLKTEAAVAPVIPVKPVYTPEVSAVDTLMELLRESFKARGATGIVGIGRKFRIVDKNKSGTVDLAEFTQMINEHGFKWTTEQIKIVFQSFDKDKSGSLIYDEFLLEIRGEMNYRRHQLVLQAYEILDADKSGVIEIDDIKSKYNGKKHPDVIAGKRTEESVLREFLDTFDSPEGKDGKVTPDEFVAYYNNISASIDNDDYFELMIRNAWHISGGEGWCANTSCRRVLVIHTDGRQTVEEIKNDIGMKADDKEAMLKNLADQGIVDVQSIELKGSTADSASAAIEPPAPSPPTPVKEKPIAGITQPHLEAPFVPPKSVSKFNPRREPGGASSIIFG
eukprot:gene23420-31764_t